MLFNSFQFIFLFLPLVLIGYYSASKFAGRDLAKLILVAMSMFFYAYWKLEYLPILLVSILCNFLCGRALATMDLGKKNQRKFLCWAAVAFNICLLSFFKYTDFVLENVYALLPTEPSFLFNYALPLGISFFTFQQIAYIIDTYNHPDTKYSLLDYSLFVSFFPQLIAGPIVHHKEIVPQFDRVIDREQRWRNFASGVQMFTIGLFKKVIIADTMAQWVNSGFDNAASLGFADAWCVSLAYTFQLYFDFSGYCDMAIGAALLVNIHIPINFSSPYKATSIQDFWRRWHITLSRWLRDYIYIPLGGGKREEHRVYLNILVTFLIGGIWHGAGWTFILWGVMHGVALVVHRMWSRHGIAIYPPLACLLTFIFINFTWVVFRAESINSAMSIYKAMLGLKSMTFMADSTLFELAGTQASLLSTLGTHLGYGFSALPPCLLLLAAICFLAPNSQELTEGIFTRESYPWNKAIVRAATLSLLLGAALSYMVAFTSTEFMYFNF